jgi:hypothetical protein
VIGLLGKLLRFGSLRIGGNGGIFGKVAMHGRRGMCEIRLTAGMFWTWIWIVVPFRFSPFPALRNLEIRDEGTKITVVFACGVHKAPTICRC